MYVQEIAMAYNATQSTTDVGQAAMAAQRWKEPVLKALTYEADLLKSVIMAKGYDPDELAAIHKLELEVLIDIQQRDRVDWEEAEDEVEAEKAWTKACNKSNTLVERFAEFGLPSDRAKLTLEIDAALELMPPTYEELTKESDAVLQECDAMLA
jgi:hypothetical protein